MVQRASDRLAENLPFTRAFLDALVSLPWATSEHCGRTLAVFARMPSGLRDPHIEYDPAGEEGAEVRFTWNRDGHYLDFAVLAGGRFEWFYSGPSGHDGTKAAPEAELPGRFFSLLRYARTDAMREADQKLAAADRPCSRCVLKSAGHASACSAGQCYVRHPRRECVPTGGESPPQSECW